MCALLFLGLLACRDHTATPHPLPDSAAPDPTDDSSPPAPPACDLDDAPREALAGDLCVSAAASCQWQGTQTAAYLGYALAAGPDLDGDGRAEVLLGANLWDDGSSGGADQGMAAILWSRTPEAGPQVWHTGQHSGDALGSAVALIDDLDGDGVPDALLGARGADLSAEESGAVYIVSGATGTVQATLGGEQAYARAGITLGGGDLDGDGLADLALAGSMKTWDGENEGYGTGRVALLYGGADGSWASSPSLSEADAALTASGTRDALGRALDLSGDIDGDGYNDLVIGAPYASSYRGQVLIVSGGATRRSGEQVAVAAAAVVLGGDEAYAAYGWSLAVGDVDGDGAAELAVGAPLADRVWDGEGAVRLYDDGGTVQRAILWGEEDDDQFGTTVVLGDVDGDGQADLLAGAIQARRGLRPLSGRLYLLPGAGLADLDGAVGVGAAGGAVRLHGAAARDYLGSATALADLDGDGRADVVTASATSQSGLGAVYLLLAPTGG